MSKVRFSKGVDARAAAVVRYIHRTLCTDNSDSLEDLDDSDAEEVCRQVDELEYLQSQLHSHSWDPKFKRLLDSARA